MNAQGRVFSKVGEQASRHRKPSPPSQGRSTSVSHREEMSSWPKATKFLIGRYFEVSGLIPALQRERQADRSLEVMISLVDIVSSRTARVLWSVK